MNRNLPSLEKNGNTFLALHESHDLQMNDVNPGGNAKEDNRKWKDDDGLFLFLSYIKTKAQIIAPEKSIYTTQKQSKRDYCSITRLYLILTNK